MSDIACGGLMSYSVRLPERLAGCLRLRWQSSLVTLAGFSDHRVIFIRCHPLCLGSKRLLRSPEKRPYYERCEPILQVTNAKHFASLDKTTSKTGFVL